MANAANVLLNGCWIGASWDLKLDLIWGASWDFNGFKKGISWAFLHGVSQECSVTWDHRWKAREKQPLGSLAGETPILRHINHQNHPILVAFLVAVFAAKFDNHDKHGNTSYIYIYICIYIYTGVSYRGTPGPPNHPSITDACGDQDETETPNFWETYGFSVPNFELETGTSLTFFSPKATIAQIKVLGWFMA